MNDNGDLILRYLERLGVEFIFGVPGGAIEPLYNALARSERNGGPKAVIARHETGAAFMAEGYARETGKLGVCCATSGPGATNLLTGVASAYADSTPVLAITGQPSLQTFGMGALQEGSCTGINTVQIFDDCTRFNTLISHPAQLERKLVMAISHAMGNNPGPVHLSVPVDIMRTQVQSVECSGNLWAFIDHEVVPTYEAERLLYDELHDKKFVTILVGEGCVGAIDDILALAEDRQWNLVTTPRAKGLIPENHRLYRGVFGFAGHFSARGAMLQDNAQRILVIGTALDEVTTGGWDQSTGLDRKRLVHISNNPDHLSRSTSALRCILGSPRLLLKRLNRRLNVKKPERWDLCELSASGLPTNYALDSGIACIDKSRPIKPQALFWYLSQIVGDTTRVYADSGSSYLWAIHYWRVHKSLENGRSPFHIGIGFSSMGWAIGAAVGAAAGAQGEPVICITGDGSALMSGQEVTTALQENLNVLFIVLNDSCLGMVKHGQALGGAEAIGTELPKVNFALMAEAMGVQAYSVHSFTDLEQVDLEHLMMQPGPCLLDIHVDSSEIPPMGNRMRVLVGSSQGEVHV
ncbi:thiamine pyrophosphate-binding protein [Ketobacter sp.]|uniref:thiamine pyrophosphate-binding protein n=1 Tax=Ketobacter sp. TaxID=2083498 RepID=UPI000F1FAEC3|nr:thiamine pyrophosphate-binding protein [Ketobacter sp.]RLT95311.1 MAG: thiamine pyrophosphate-binding protein [Ketobacter sp.]